MPLPDGWVDRIFARMAVRYGIEWTRRWEGLDLAAVKADWAAELANIPADSLGYALGYLPVDRPPTVAQFRETCLRAPVRQLPRLPEPKADSARVAAAIGQIGKPPKRDPKQWAWDLKALHEADERIPIAHVVMYRAVTDPPKYASEAEA